MNTPITELQWLVLATSSDKGLRDARGAVWRVLRPWGSVARPNALRLEHNQEEREFFWYKGQIWNDQDGAGGFVPGGDFNHPGVAIINVP